jgi:hypothetical protein
VPQGWTPPANWQPDPSWPAPPPGWQLWIEDGAAVAVAAPPVAAAVPPAGRPAVAPGSASADSALAMNSNYAIAGGVLIFIGAWLPFIHVTVTLIGSGDFKMPVFLQLTSAIWGLILGGLGFGMRKTPGFGTALMVLAILGLIGYGAFTLFGIAGISIFHFYPNVGLIFALLGNVAVLVGASRSKARYVYQTV